MTSAIVRVQDFGSWRNAARAHLQKRTPPSEITWQAADDDRQFLFQEGAAPLFLDEPASEIKLPRAFVEDARTVALHRDPDRWSLLYRIAWRIQNENRNLLAIEVDDDIRAMVLMLKAIGRDIHKMRAFVRFRRVLHKDDGEGAKEQEAKEQYVAWYRPDHHILAANERFFADRFAGMRWAILTPDRSMLWDLKKIHYGPGAPRRDAPAEDELDDLWRTYYRSIYNPARLNPDAMKAELPMHRWIDLPESRVIPELMRLTRGRVESMATPQSGAASAFIPQDAELPALREAVQRCSACELCGRATQAVFGEGSPTARIAIIGEQPGDEEDRAGRPFVGPAGRVLDAAMREAGLERSSVYLTNAVKAFRFEERGKRRIHQTPRPSHIATCRPWLDAEIDQVQPDLIVCLGASAAQAVLGRTVSIKEERGQRLRSRWGTDLMITYHPSAVLRAPDETARAAMQQALIEDLRTAALSKKAEAPVAASADLPAQ